MFNNFNTEMERAREIQSLREGQCCQQFRDCWPEQEVVVMKMTSKAPTERPSARDLLTNVPFLSSKQQVKILKQSVLEKEQALQEMAVKFKEKDEMIQQLRKQINHPLVSDNVS